MSKFAPGPNEALLNLIRAADEAATWITEARAIAKSEGTISSLPGHKDLHPGLRGQREVRNIRAAIRNVRTALEKDRK